jgi:predicted peroxiredoxin|tara:strand:- start:603 stop:1016 length:414 start_codon:yes stop_codon:yes gene_type:complete
LLDGEATFMSKRIFVKFVSEPKNDPLKTIVGLACASQAVADGHDVNVFFAASGVRILDGDYLDQLENELGGETPMVRPMMDALLGGATLHCSFGSVMAVLGHAEGDGALVVPDDKIAWSGPPGVIALATDSDVQLVY